jgi:serine/threonine-protein kinase HipA
VRLAPLYDFAPMVFDTQGIARVCRWREEDGGYPRWSYVADALAKHDLDRVRTVRELQSLSGTVRELPSLMRDAKVPASVIERLDARIARVADDLEATR